MANLMDAAGADKSPESLIVNVKDHDTPDVPGDLAGGTTSFWKQKDVRIWLYVLGAAVLVLVVVFVLLSRQTSLFQGYTRVSVSNNTETVDEGDLDDFNASAANDEFDGLGDDIVGEGDFAAEPGEGGSVDINDLLDGVVNPGDLEPDEDDLESLFDDIDADDEDEVNEDDDDNGGEPVLGSTFAPSQIPAPPAPNNGGEIINVDQNGDFPGMDLNSNTDSGVLDSPDLQGDTGPSVVLALIPSIFYAVARRRKNEI